MIKRRPNKASLFFLIIAFVSVQWSVTHIHLAERHSHHHYHDAQAHAHAHYEPGYHEDIMGLVHTANDYKAVELDNDCKSIGREITSGQQITSISYQTLFAPEFHGEPLPEWDSNKQSYITYSTTMLRAPPQIS